MEKKNLIITVAGHTASGKSRLTYLLKKFLRENGFEVEQELNIDHPTEENFDSAMGKNFDAVIEHFKETRKITLREVPTANKNIEYRKEKG
jgi:uridine kinase